MGQASVGFTDAELKEKDSLPAQRRVNAALQKLRDLQGAAINAIIHSKWRTRVGLMPSYAATIIKTVLRFTGDASSTIKLNQSWADALALILDKPMAELRIAHEKTLSKAISTLFGILRVCITRGGTESAEAASAVIDLWSDADPSFGQYQTGAEAVTVILLSTH